MKTTLIQKNPAVVRTELLVVFAINQADPKVKNADPVIKLLHGDAAINKAVRSTLRAGRVRRHQLRDPAAATSRRASVRSGFSLSA